LRERRKTNFFGRSDLKGRGWLLHYVAIIHTLGFVEIKEKQEVRMKEVILRFDIG
jgi:hypothetical protein